MNDNEMFCGIWFQLNFICDNDFSIKKKSYDRI